eukprot:COSAG06_NODE_33547_length_486_cov_0.640103_1_plen_89_part_01
MPTPLKWLDQNLLPIMELYEALNSMKTPHPARSAFMGKRSWLATWAQQEHKEGERGAAACGGHGGGGGGGDGSSVDGSGQSRKPPRPMP